jgi:hypothetical protein
MFLYKILAEVLLRQNMEKGMGSSVLRNSLIFKGTATRDSKCKILGRVHERLHIGKQQSCEGAGA